MDKKNVKIVWGMLSAFFTICLAGIAMSVKVWLGLFCLPELAFIIYNIFKTAYEK